MDERAGNWGPAALAVISGSLLAWGAFTLLQFMEDDELGGFWVRLGVGIAVAAVTVWAAWRQHWLATTFLALACCITPVGAGWTWVQLLCIALAVWTFVLFIADIMRGHTR
ncbi:hypothetical protein [Demequina sp.]|uniref:hypothetical protein n=1 Tax=Demequina sp. TaxID=2050685 RepID=UPI003D152E26